MSDETASAQAEELAGRLFGAGIAAMDLLSVYLGDRLGYYRALAGNGSGLTSGEIAARTSTHERYAREWLEQQAVTGILSVDDQEEGPEKRRYSIPAGHAEVLTEPTSLFHLAPLAQAMVGVARNIPAVLDAYRTGGGVPWPDFGDDIRQGQEGLNRPFFVNLLTTEYLAKVEDVHARLSADPPARVADIACGAGWSSIAIARGYPTVTVEGVDFDEPLIETARKNAAAAGVSDRVRFHVADASRPGIEGLYDLVTIFEALHDMSHPVEALRTARGLRAEGGAVIVMDEKVAEKFTAPGDDVERFMYGSSILLCLPGAMGEQPSAATGTVMRTETLREYANDAGFDRVEILPLEHDFFRFYRLID